MTAVLALPLGAIGAYCAYVAGARHAAFGPNDNPALVLIFLAGLFTIVAAAW